MKRPIRVLIVDDNLSFIKIVESFLTSQPDIQVVGIAKSGEESIEQASISNPDLVLMDVSMPGMNGFEATRQINKKSNPPRVIILTLYNLPEYRRMAESVGAEGFVSKDQFGSVLLESIHKLFPGQLN